MIGYQVITASNGNEALQQFQSCEPDLVVLDVMMPKLDGYGVIQELRKECEVLKFVKPKKSELKKFCVKLSKIIH